MPAGDDLLRRAAEANTASFAAIAVASAGARSLAEPGVRAIATPAAPERPLFNAAVGLEPGALAGAYDRLADFYTEARVPRWTDSSIPRTPGPWRRWPTTGTGSTRSRA